MFFTLLVLKTLKNIINSVKNYLYICIYIYI